MSQDGSHAGSLHDCQTSANPDGSPLRADSTHSTGHVGTDAADRRPQAALAATLDGSLRCIRV